MAALLVIVACFGGLGTWATFAPIDSAAVAPARVTVAGNRGAVDGRKGGPGAESTEACNDDQQRSHQRLSHGRVSRNGGWVCLAAVV